MGEGLEKGVVEGDMTEVFVFVFVFVVEDFEDWSVTTRIRFN